MHQCTCQECGKEFQSKETPNSKKTTRFCSQRCFNLSKRKIKDVQAAIAMYESGMTQVEIAKNLGVNTQDVSKAFKREGYKLPRKTTNRTSGGKNGNWKGGVVMRRGYVAVKCPGHPRASEDGDYVPQHILAMERYLGRYLNYYGLGHPDNEVVHHINHNTLDNRIENLQLMKALQHNRLHQQEAVAKRSKKVRRMDTGEIFQSARAASLAIGMSPGAVREAIKSQRPCKGTTWEYVN